MPSVSKSQASAAGVALAAKRSEVPQSHLHGPAKQMERMSVQQLREYAGTKHKGLPQHKKH